MAHSKRMLRRSSPPPKRANALEGVKYACPSPTASPSTSGREISGALSHKPTPDRAMHASLSPLLDQGVMQRMANLALRPQASHEASQLWIQVTLCFWTSIFFSFCSTSNF
ncbi:hypothetical protein LIER_32514 [Lithospermum erythrorhizon]|uniref:Uncharacterized protein n=1 Tax=Lithospermum erythrorhizon TaxID=34254 RepID=A0AAV3RU23_LITER